MVLRAEGLFDIDNLRNYPPETVEKLRALLAAGVQARPDPHRQNFFELDNGAHAFYVHVSPKNGKVYLLAAWDKGGSAAGAESPGSRAA